MNIVQSVNYKTAYVAPIESAQHDPKLPDREAAKNWARTLDRNCDRTHAITTKNVEEFISNVRQTERRDNLPCDQDEGRKEYARLEEWVLPIVLLYDFNEDTLKKVSDLPLGGLVVIPDHIAQMQDWMKEYRPERLEPRIQS